ncbi:MAG: PilT/PilU family type 4a pilus ATPase [Chitinivibrionales bacterium]|nr:PilT/PilU family type 4a pilus ATPase [Chitinivibrionales bacterium]
MAQIDSLFRAMLKVGGSDLHLEQGQVPKVRLHGDLLPMNNVAATTGEQMELLLQEIAGTDVWDAFEETGDADFAYQMGTEARFRANYLKQFSGYGAVFRVIPSEILSLKQINAPSSFQQFADYHCGLILVTGPTGSGKSTTLAAIIDHINQTGFYKIITIEEPVEFVHTGKRSIVVHREVGLDSKSFSSGLRGAIKSDVNVILVGEMRDEETIELALQAAEMGMLVFGTLHTNSAVKTIDRIVDAFPAKKKAQIRPLLANTLKAVISQQLLKSVDGKRRWAAHEILLSTPALPPIVRSGETVKLANLMQTNRQLGMITMDDCLLDLVKEGKVSKKQAYLKACDKDRFNGADFS